jgi:hypothetical protein
MFNTGYTLEVYMQDHLTSRVEVSKTGEITFTNFTDIAVFLPFGVNKTATMKDLQKFYEDRCFPRERVNCDEILKDLGLDCYDPERICRITHGQQFDDFIWLQFSDEPQVEYKDIKLRD